MKKLNDPTCTFLPELTDADSNLLLNSRKDECLALKTENSYCNELNLKLDTVKTMKWLLAIEDLQKEIDAICYANFALLVMLNHYISEMPEKVKTSVNQIIEAKDKPKLCKKLYLAYLKNYKMQTEFKEFKRYIVMNRAVNLLNDISDEKNVGKILDEVVSLRMTQLILIYNIIKNDFSMYFAQKDILENIPQLYCWVRENKNRAIEKLTDDECEILAGCTYGFSYDEMLEKLNLSSAVKDYKSVNELIKNLPSKFGVSNLTQVLFRTLLLKPHIWSQGEHEYVIEAIKSITGGEIK